MSWDYQLFQLINSLSGHNNYFDLLGIILANGLIFVIILLTLVAAFSKRKIFIRALASSAIAYVTGQIIGKIYFRSRPFVSHQVIQLISKSPAEKSFPSDHAAISFALAFSIYLLNKSLGRIAILLAALVCLGRIMVGVHYPLDVIAGAAIGVLAAYFVSRH